ncbi:MAG TPA: alternative ribosome rescue aminoacyl-tRNA hydrolase ArfB [Frankiaceae bacterium]|nr:alternative ribosome rescue aminoacyl-tRNA hydrolase ArfB [Frankiaceae bacterium]
MPDEIEVRPGLKVSESDLQWRFSRASGPGGQGVNTTDSRVQLSFDLRLLPEPFRGRARASLSAHSVDDVITVVASERRSQFQNRASATARLVDLLRAATAPPPPKRRRTRPTRSAVERRLAGKRQRAEIKRLRRPNPGQE